MASRYLKEVEWQILHAINLYIYRNGKDGEQPILVHIPPEKKNNMKSLMKVIQDRVKFPIGYATQLYNMEGKKVKLISELEQYHCYVAATNYDKHFVCTQYGRKRSPLLVLNRDSKHVRYNIRTDNYERMLKKKFVSHGFYLLSYKFVCNRFINLLIFMFVLCRSEKKSQSAFTTMKALTTRIT